MTTQESIALALAIAIAVLSLLGAFVAWRALSRAGSGMRAIDATLADVSRSMPQQMAGVRAAMSQVDAIGERALWALVQADERMDAGEVSIRARRDASDRLRARLIEGRGTLARLRETIRLLMRLNELRREFWA